MGLCWADWRGGRRAEKRGRTAGGLKHPPLQRLVRIANYRCLTVCEVAAMLRGRRGLALRIRRPGEYFCRIDVSALWSVIFVLSIMTVMVRCSRRNMVIFPTCRRFLHAWQLPGAMRDDAMRIALTRDGRYFFGGTQITLGQMAERIRAAVADGAEKRVFLTVDQRLKYRSVKGVADEIRKGGVGRVSFLTQ